MAKMKSINELPVDGAFKRLGKLFETYPLLDDNKPTSFIIWSDQPPNVEEYFQKICHRDMPFLKPGFDHLITAVPNTDPIALAYIQMLITGPFRAFSDLISLQQLNGQYFLRCSELGKWPANVLYNFCIASRIPIEAKSFLPYWNELTEKGYDPTLAFLLSYSKRGDPTRNTRVFPDTGHMWVDPASSWKNILDGTMIKMSPPFKEYPAGCRPCNAIWGDSRDWLHIRDLSDETVSEYYKLPIEPITAPPPPPPNMKKGLGIGGVPLQQFIAEQAQLNAQAHAQLNQHLGGQQWVQVNPFVVDGNGVPQPVEPQPPQQPMHQLPDEVQAVEPEEGWEFFDEPIFDEDEDEDF